MNVEKLIIKHLSNSLFEKLKQPYFWPASAKLTWIYICILLGVDTSSPALELAKENIVLNDMDPRRISFLREDAIEFMKSALSQNESWDLVILDPPKLAPRRKVLCVLSVFHCKMRCRFRNFR